LLKDENNEVFVTARNKDITLQLLKEENISYKLLGNNHPGLIGKIKNLFEYDYLLYKYSKLVKPDIFISHSSIYAAHVAFLLGKKSITLEDTGNAEQSLFYRPFTAWIITPDCLKKNYGKKQIKYKGFHELAYLHPNYFKPDEHFLHKIGIKTDEKISLVRFVSRNSSHDIGVKGLSLYEKIKIVKSLTEFSKVFISSEDKLPRELLKYQIDIPFSQIHHLIYFADLVIGESATMSSEAAILGTPSIYLDMYGRHYTDYQEEKYGLVYNFVREKFSVEKALKQAGEILANVNHKTIFRGKADALINDHIDVTQFLFDFIHSKLNSQ